MTGWVARRVERVKEPRNKEGRNIFDGDFKRWLLREKKFTWYKERGQMKVAWVSI